MLLVITNRSDLSSDYLILKIKERSIPFARLNTEDYGIDYKIDINLSKTSNRFVIKYKDGITIEDEEISAVYFHHPSPPIVEDVVTKIDQEFAAREALEVLRSIWRMIPEKKWLNHPKYLWRAVNKVEQLLEAVNIGFHIPNTLITSDKDSVSSFIESTNNHIIAKAVKHGFVYREKEIWVASTHRLSSSYLQGYETYAEIPISYQHEIDKAYDIRVVVVGHQVFATAIHSQVHEETEVDWRLGDMLDIDLNHEKIKLPGGIENKCRDLVKLFSLRYSSMDMVYSKDGEYFFLELNPNGQWAWIEQEVGYPIRESIIDTLTKAGDDEF
ncbi:MAG: hypothetical protein HQ507_08155 [Candidatus Marinimicrobia bacterium]|nr:hypothetical protein [Candidatus Neomarinimicrobiota bacterium]